MPELKVERALTLTGLGTIRDNNTITGDAADPIQPTVTAAKTGTLTTRTDSDTGEITGTGGHGIITGDIIDVFWTLLGVEYSRRSMTVGTVATNAIPIDGGSGDVLPATSTAVTFMVHHTEELGFSGSNLVGYVFSSPVHGWVKFMQSATVRAGIELELDSSGRNYTATWYSGNGVTNPIAGQTITHVAFSHGDSSGSSVMTAGVLRN